MKGIDIMPKKELLKKFATLAVETGANVQKGQLVGVNAPTDAKELAREIVEAAYKAGAKRVVVNWTDAYVGRSNYDGMTIEELENIPQWSIDRLKSFIKEDGCIISITSPIPGVNKGVDPIKMQKAGIASSKAFDFYRNHMMGNHAQWSIVAYPNEVWAEKVFPDLKGDEAVEALWNAILQASRVTETNDPVEEWAKHNESLLSHNKILNDFNFKQLHFTNGIGTDLVVGLVPNHVWAGGGENSTRGVYFNPNIPTEENFTMPDKYNVNGKVVATKPLDYQGKLINDFYLIFKDGAVVEYDAKDQKEALDNLIKFDEGSKYIGEVALISHDSPIQNSGILFYNTLFDENASCHLALGRAYPMNVKGGTKMSQEELTKAGANNSMTHVDFMFGSEDMNIVGIQQDGTKVQVFKDGNFVI
jgi:aminopeptidase